MINLKKMVFCLIYEEKTFVVFSSRKSKYLLLKYNTPTTHNFAYLSKVPNEKRKFVLIPTNVHTLKTDLVTIPI